MDQKNFSLLQGVMLDSMAKEINKKMPEDGRIGSSAEEVFNNLPSIYEMAVDRSFGEDNGSYNYMPLQYKAMVMRLVAPEYCPSIRAEKTDNGVFAEAFLYLTPEDNRPVASGKMFVSFASVRERFTDAEQENILFFTEELARGSALSKAYEKFGIGSWFKRKYTMDDNPDEVLADLENQDKVQPVTAYETESVKETPVSEELTPAQETVPTTALAETLRQDDGSNVPKNEQSVPDATTPDNPAEPGKAEESVSQSAADNSLQINLEEAKAMKATIGKAADMGLTLGETAERFPGNILWMYTQDVPVKDKVALTVIAKSNPEISGLFKQRGIAL